MTPMTSGAGFADLLSSQKAYRLQARPNPLRKPGAAAIRVAPCGPANRAAMITGRT